MSRGYLLPLSVRVGLLAHSFLNLSTFALFTLKSLLLLLLLLLFILFGAPPPPRVLELGLRGLDLGSLEERSLGSGVGREGSCLLTWICFVKCSTICERSQTYKTDGILK